MSTTPTIGSSAGTTTFTGLNGFDFNALISATVQSASAPMQALQAQQAALQNRDSALTSIGSQLNQLESTVQTLGSQSSFTNVTAASSDSTIATVSGGSGGIASTYDLNIANTAKSQVTSSTTGYANTTYIAADGGSISFTIMGQTTAAIQITGQTTLSALAGQINSQNSGVFAAVVNDGTNNKLVLMSQQTGQNNGFTVNNNLTNSTGTAVTFAAGQSPTSGNTQNASDASFTLNGMSITSSSNTVSTAIPGVTISLQKAGDTTVNVTPDYSTLEKTLSTFVSQYNGLQSAITQQSTSSNGQTAPLANDPVTRQILSDLATGLMAANTGGGQYTYLSEIGLEFNTDGTLTFDSSTFEKAMNTSSTDVQTLLQGSNGTGGLFNKYNSILEADDNTSGLISNTRASDKLTNDNYTNEIAAQQTMLQNMQTTLTKYYAAADQAMTQLRSEGSSLSQIGSNSSLFNL